MTDSGAIESDLERFQKTFPVHPRIKPPSRRVEPCDMKPRVQRLRQDTRTHIYACVHVRTIATKRTKVARNDEERQKENGMEGEGG